MYINHASLYYLILYLIHFSDILDIYFYIYSMIYLVQPDMQVLLSWAVICNKTTWLHWATELGVYLCYLCPIVYVIL